MLWRLALSCLIVVSGGAKAEPVVIRWQVYDFPPFTEVDQALPGNGIADDIVKYLIQRLPQYQHEVEVSTLARTLAAMANGEQVCFPTAKSLRERERIMSFSRPAIFMPSLHLIVRQEAMAKLAAHTDSAGAVDVGRLVDDVELVGTASDQRGYSAVINVALSDAAGQRMQRSGVNHVAPFYQLASGWIDYMFAYPAELLWFLQQNPKVSAKDFQTVPVKGHPKYMIGHIACSQGAWGRQVIADIDAQLLAAGPRPFWVDKVMKFIPPEEVEQYERALQQQRPYNAP